MCNNTSCSSAREVTVSAAAVSQASLHTQRTSSTAVSSKFSVSILQARDPTPRRAIDIWLRRHPRKALLRYHLALSSRSSSLSASHPHHVAPEPAALLSPPAHPPNSPCWRRRPQPESPRRNQRCQFPGRRCVAHAVRMRDTESDSDRSRSSSSTAGRSRELGAKCRLRQGRLSRAARRCRTSGPSRGVEDGSSWGKEDLERHQDEDAWADPWRCHKFL